MHVGGELDSLLKHSQKVILLMIEEGSDESDPHSVFFFFFCEHRHMAVPRCWKSMAGELGHAAAAATSHQTHNPTLPFCVFGFVLDM